jgi:hypothetical protein
MKNTEHVVQRLFPRCPEYRPRVAVVEPDADARMAICQVLSEMLIAVSPFCYGREIAEVDPNLQFDAFVLEWGRDETYLHRLVSSIRGLSHHAHSPIFLLTDMPSEAGVPLDPQLRLTISLARLIFRPKPYSTIVLGHEIYQSLDGKSNGCGFPPLTIAPPGLPQPCDRPASDIR